ncbi:CocE/NonD family hydrolase [Actinomadura parmotrematis]|uniref:CocE/NonD family hydrolase n=1 Tax=Actinomadura parmotrematis TaxID=2864039 RepID=A0ABS7FWV2_9ACTN|nr:CocE/NonD family hydrolase [Actinomadura parmotrematis]MBW8484910.1 CocE/NonD family hydrolase [Actinomadura parmotrematis]
MRRAIRWTAPLAAAALAFGGAVPPAHAAPAKAAAAAWKARPAAYGVTAQQDVRLTMSDGVQLVADIRRPALNGRAAPGRFPVIVTMTPYNKTLPGANMADDYLVQRGYVQVIVDVRGTGGSHGKWEAFSRREQLDGKEAVEWASSAKRPWSDGRVAMVGASYGGINQIFTAAQHPKGLKAIFPVVPMGDSYRDVIGTGGQLGLGFVPLWLAGVGGLSLLPPTYSGKSPDEAIALLKEHFGNIGDFQIAMLFNALTGGDKAFDGPFYRERSPLEVVDKVNVPAFVVGGEFDIFQRSEPLLYQRLARRVPARFTYGPWYHISGAAPALGLPLPNVPQPPGPSMQELMLRWFDHYVRGAADPGLDRDVAPVTYYDNGAGTWRTAGQWPPAGVRYRALRLTGRAGLTTGQGSGGPDAVPFQPFAGLCSRSTVQWAGAGVLGLFGWSCELDNGENDRLGAVYDLPVTKPLRLAGPINAHLSVSTAAKDGQLTVRVEDVAPDGRATQLTAGWQVLSLRALDGARTVRQDGLTTIPYHPFTKASAKAMPKNAPVGVDVEVFPIAATVQPGHRLRVSVQTADFPHLFPDLPQLGNSLGGGVRIWHDAAHPSWVALPVQG